jgi:hypothetical protein
MKTVLRYELSGDRQGLRKFVRHPEESDDTATGHGPIMFHVHSNEMTELEQWIHGLLSSPNALELLNKCYEILYSEYPEHDPRHPSQWGLDTGIAELEAVEP